MLNADLFWVLRGGNFRIVVSITFRPLPFFTFGYMLFDNVSPSMMLSAIGKNDFDSEFNMELYLKGTHLYEPGPKISSQFEKFAINLLRSRSNCSTFWETFYTKFPALENRLPYKQTITQSVTKTLADSRTMLL